MGYPTNKLPLLLPNQSDIIIVVHLPNHQCIILNKKNQLNYGFFYFSGSLADRVSKMSDETLHQMVGFLGPDQSFPLMQEYNKRWKNIQNWFY